MSLLVRLFVRHHFNWTTMTALFLKSPGTKQKTNLFDYLDRNVREIGLTSSTVYTDGHGAFQKTQLYNFLRKCTLHFYFTSSRSANQLNGAARWQQHLCSQESWPQSWWGLGGKRNGDSKLILNCSSWKKSQNSSVYVSVSSNEGRTETHWIVQRNYWRLSEKQLFQPHFRI